MTRLRTLLLACALLWLAGCNNGRPRVKLQLVSGDSGCTASHLQQLKAVKVMLEGGEDSRSGKCIAVAPSQGELGEVQRALAGATTFEGIMADQVTVTLAGYNDGDCKSAITVCGRADLARQTQSGSASLPLYCSNNESAFQTCSSLIAGHPFTRTAGTRLFGSGLRDSEVNSLASFDLLATNRFFYNDLDGHSWETLRGHNPTMEIYLRQLGPLTETDSDSDSVAAEFNSSIARWGNARGHSMGALSTDRRDLVADDKTGSPLRPSAGTEVFLDVAQADAATYWVEATVTDLDDKPWTADGVFVERAAPRLKTSGQPKDYSDDRSWSTALSGFLEAVTRGLRAKKQKVWIDRGDFESGWPSDAVGQLGQADTPPDVQQVNAFLSCTKAGRVVFDEEASWRDSIDLIATVTRSRLVVNSNCNLDSDQTATDADEQTHTVTNLRWYALASYQLGKRDPGGTSYFAFQVGNDGTPDWSPEYDAIDLGSALPGSQGDYQTLAHQDQTVYWRAFQRGYVFVNASSAALTNIPLPEPCKQLSPEDFDRPAKLPTIEHIELNGHRGAFLVKESAL